MNVVLLAGNGLPVIAIPAAIVVIVAVFVFSIIKRYKRCPHTKGF